MAGIGFELRRLLRHDSLFGLLRGYGYAGLISSGPWVLSILGVMMIGALSAAVPASAEGAGPFLVAITYVMACSLILTGPLQLLLTRFIADRLYEERAETILPNVMGALLLTSLTSSLLATGVVTLAFEEPWPFRVLLVVTFVTVCDLWVLLVLMSALKAYRSVLGTFLLGYALSVAGALALRPHGMTGLLGGFLCGQAWMLVAFVALIFRHYPMKGWLSFELLVPKNARYGLALVGLFFNLGVWADKLLFWMNPATSHPVLGPLRASLLYDLPMFLAYLSIIPGMAVYLVRIETDFAEQYQGFFDGIRRGATLSELERMRLGMVRAVRRGMVEVFQVQGITVVILFLLGPRILELLGISRLHAPLFNVDLVGAAGQVLLLCVLNVFFYLDRRRAAVALTGLLLGSNVALTLLTQWAGPRFYGYGFAVAVFLTSLVGLAILSRRLDRLIPETYMLQP